MPTLLQLSPLRPGLQAVLERTYIVHQQADGWLPGHEAEVDALVTSGHAGVPAGLMEQLPNLKIVAINGVGYDKVDLAVARGRGIRVTNTPDVLTDDVADLAVGLLIGVMRRLHLAHAHVSAGRWPASEMPLSRKVSGKRFGILGMGRIGQAVARRLLAFDGTIRYTGPAPKGVPYLFDSALLQLAHQSDVLVVCAAASAATKGIVNRAVLDALGAEGVLVNIARGSIVDEPALVAALQEGTLGAAALDVFTDEPHVPAALLGMDNVLLTPHIASATDETRRAMGLLMLDNLAAFFAGEPLPTAVA